MSVSTVYRCDRCEAVVASKDVLRFNIGTQSFRGVFQPSDGPQWKLNHVCPRCVVEMQAPLRVTPQKAVVVLNWVDYQRRVYALTVASNTWGTAHKETVLAADALLSHVQKMIEAIRR